MVTTQAINYCDTYFEYPGLTQIEGDPGAEHLIRLNKELKLNALSAVYSKCFMTKLRS